MPRRCSGCLCETEVSNSPTTNLTALGSLVLIRSEMVHRIQLWNFSTSVWESLLDSAAFHSHASHASFPRSFFDALCPGWTRKGFLLTRWRLDGTAIGLLNVHLFHDESNLRALQQRSGAISAYAACRQRGLRLAVERAREALEGNGDGKRAAAAAADGLFVFGDFNFRLDALAVVRLVAGEEALSTAMCHSDVPGSTLSLPVNVPVAPTAASTTTGGLAAALATPAAPKTRLTGSSTDPSHLRLGWWPSQWPPLCLWLSALLRVVGQCVGQEAGDRNTVPPSGIVATPAAVAPSAAIAAPAAALAASTAPLSSSSSALPVAAVSLSAKTFELAALPALLASPAHLLACDLELAAFNACGAAVQLHERPIGFPPSYALEPGQLTRDYVCKRCPSWCDRVLMDSAAAALVAAGAPAVPVYGSASHTRPVLTDHDAVHLAFDLA